MRRYAVEAIERCVAGAPAGYLMAETDPVLGELWDNDEDCVYDDL